MKKAFAILMALCMLLSAAALAEAADYTGVWYLTTMETEEGSFAAADFGMEMSMDIKDDGTVATAGNLTEGQEGSWVSEGEGITITIDDSPMTFALVDGNLVGEQDGQKMIFGREKIEGYAPAEANAEATEADFAGNWITFKYGFDSAYMDADIVGIDVSAAIEGTTITLNGLYFDNTVIEAAFADGALTYTAADPDSEIVASVAAQMLQDDTLCLTLDMGGEVALIMNRAEVEAE